MKKIPVSLLLLFCFVFANAQRTTIYTNKDADFRTAQELFNKEKYSAAQKLFNNIILQYKGQVSEIAIESEYYAALCAYELFNVDAEKLLYNFIINHPENAKAKLADFYLGNYLYRKKRFKEAIPFFEKVNVFEIDGELLAEYYFKSGYCYFENGQLDNAKNNFYQIKDVETKYTSAATYYFSHIAYLQKNYQIALQGFFKLGANENFAPVVPYYITQIYFLQGKYEDVIAYAPVLLDSADAQRAPEIARLLGESYYSTKRFKEAIPYFEKYQKGENVRTTREDDYQMAYCQYKALNYLKAIDLFRSVAVQKDSMGQNASYLLGDCYVKSDQKKMARLAFETASKLSFDPEISEDALFNFAKLAYELDYNPFDESIKAFEKYLNTYPLSSRKDEAYKYLLNVYLTTRNYKAALESIDNIKEKSQDLKYAYQKVSYLRGVELFNNQSYKEAIEHFEKSGIYPLDKNVQAQSAYWKAEAYYRLNDYDKAIEHYKKFIYEPAAIIQDVFNDANYNLGYAYYQKMQYNDAIMWFRKFVADKKEPDQKKLNDAFIRIGDCYFIKKELADAVEYYDEAIKIKLLDIDYAMFQKAVAMGVLGKYDQKAETLEELIKTFPASKNMPEACYELANTSFMKGNNDKALMYFDKVISNYPNSSYLKRALLKKGLIYYNGNQDLQALEIYKRIVSDYPGSTEAKEALTGIKNIYVEQGKPNEYADYIQHVPFANVSVSELDSTTFEVAEKHYMQGDCEKAITDFSNYISKYPNGLFLLNANFYKAECETKLNKLNDALVGYNYVISKPRSKFTETALLKASRIAKSTGNCELTVEYYSKLEMQAEVETNLQEAVINLMRCNFKLNKYNDAKAYAAKAQLLNKASGELIEEARLITSKSLLSLGDTANAMIEFAALSNLSKTEICTEAKYTVAALQFSKKNYAETEKLVYEIIKQVPAYDYWIARSFILLADVFDAKNDWFSAKNTLQSIVDNADNPELIKTAQEKIDAISAKEKEAALKKMSVPQTQINMNDNTIDEQLFEEEVPTEGGNNNE